METMTNCNRCGGNACLQQTQDNSTSWFCFGCGFSTATELVNTPEMVEEIQQTLPELYKDLMYIDSENRIWLPATITLPEVGIVFLDGDSVYNWGWSAALAVKIEEEEKHRFPEGQELKIDYVNKRFYGKKDFMDALEYIGFFKQTMQQEKINE